MALFNMTELRALLRPGERLLGLDPGARTVGVALSDVGLMLASPYGPLTRGKLAANAARVAAIARKEGAAGLVVGWPLSMDGTMGPAAQAARDWARALTEATGLPGALWDERLSSAAANRALIAADLSRAKRAAAVDSLAAAYMLQAALDASRPGGQGVVAGDMDAAGPSGGRGRAEGFGAGSTRPGCALMLQAWLHHCSEPGGTHRRDARTCDGGACEGGACDGRGVQWPGVRWRGAR